MRQALHIFNKDVRYLRAEIALMLTFAAIFVVNGDWWVDLLFIATAMYLIAQVVHAEMLPGDRQFWITRPYRWQSLIGAKVLFILVFVNLPIFIDQFLLLTIGRFPFRPSLPGLLWSQVLLILVATLPVAALATVTSGMTSFLFSTLILLAVGFGGQRGVIPGPRTLLAPVEPWPVQVEWQRDCIAAIALVAIAFFVLRSQYSSRQTLFSRIGALSGAVAAAIVFVYVPWTAAFALQSSSRQLLDPSSLRLVVDPKARAIENVNGDAQETVRVEVSMTVNGVPNGTDVDALSVSVKGEDGRSWKSGEQDFNALSGTSTTSGITFTTSGLMDRSFFEREREKAVSLHASLFLTTFGNTRSKTIPIQSTPVNVMDGIQCYVDVIFRQLVCRSAFRWPSLAVNSDTGSFTRGISYSPFPAGFHLNPIETRGATSGPGLSAREVTITVKEPLSHFRRDVELNGVRLGDLVRPANDRK